MLIFGKLLTALASPITFAILVLVYAGLARSVSRQKMTTRLACLTAAALLFSFGSGFGSRLLVQSLEDRFKRDNIASAPASPAIVVLGGGLTGAGLPLALGPHADRLWLAAELYKAGKAPVILICGGGDRKVAESALASRILQAWGIPLSAILMEEKSRDTHQNAVFGRHILAEKGIASILLVTSAIHMPRAFATFRRTGLTVSAVPADFLSDDEPPDLLAFIPSAGALGDSGSAIKEWLGIAVYRLRGWAI